MSRYHKTLLLAVVAFTHLKASPPRAVAHQKWLWPNVFQAAKAPLWISIDATWSDRPFTATDGIGEDSIAIVNPDGGRRAPSKVFAGKTKSTAEAELTQPGTYRLESVDAPTYWTQLRVDGKEQWKKAPKTEVGGGEIIRSDLYYAEAVAYVTIGEPTPLPALDPADPIEIRLTAHPSALKAGAPIELQVLSYGQPVNAAKVNVIGERGDSHRPDATITCDDQGRGPVPLKSPGRYLLSCEWEQAVKNDPKADVHALNAFLTIEVAN